MFFFDLGIYEFKNKCMIMNKNRIEVLIGYFE